MPKTLQILNRELAIAVYRKTYGHIIDLNFDIMEKRINGRNERGRSRKTFIWEKLLKILFTYDDLNVKETIMEVYINYKA